MKTVMTQDNPSSQYIFGAISTMDELAHTTSVMSWQLLVSAIERIRADEAGVTPIDLNLESPSCVILCCVALEAFANEMSCLTSAFLFNMKNNPVLKYSPTAQQEEIIGLALDSCQAMAEIRNDRSGSFYDRYKTLLTAANIDKPDFLQRLSHLRDLRDNLVHYRTCKMLVVDDSDGVIRTVQEVPEVFAHLKSYQVNGWPVVAEGPKKIGTKWTLRVSTNAMAAWCLMLVLDAITYVIKKLPAGAFQDHVLRQYKSRDESFNIVFEKGMADVEKWKNGLFAEQTN